MKYSYVIILMFFYYGLFSQNKIDIGSPIIRNYSAKEYGYSSQTWAVTKDNRGVIYVGSNDGILEFDGINWKLIQTTNKSHIRSLATDSNGLVYVGASSDFGYLSINKLGERIYNSLLEKVDSSERMFSEVWSINTTSNGVYFFTEDRIFRYFKDSISIINIRTQLFSSNINDKLYVLTEEGGVALINGEEISVLPYTEQIGKKTLGITKIVSYNKNKILIIADVGRDKDISRFFYL